MGHLGFGESRATQPTPPAHAAARPPRLAWFDEGPLRVVDFSATNVAEGSVAGLRGRPLTGTRFLSHWRFETAGW